MVSRSFIQKSVKDPRVHLNVNGNNPVEGDKSVKQEMMRIIARVKSVGRRRGQDPELRWTSVGGRGTSSIEKGTEANRVRLDSYAYGSDNL